jgi:hypothetical protein
VGALDLSHVPVNLGQSLPGISDPQRQTGEYEAEAVPELGWQRLIERTYVERDDRCQLVDETVAGRRAPACSTVRIDLKVDAAATRCPETPTPVVAYCNNPRQVPRLVRTRAWGRSTVG